MDKKNQLLTSNYHTHTKLCNHAGGIALDYVKKAIELGFEEIGISDHGPLPIELETPDIPGEKLTRNMNKEEFYKYYLPDLDLAIKTYSNRIKIYRGIETEYIPQFHDHYVEMRKNLDYLILGIHFFYIGNTKYNTYGGVDKNTIYNYANTAVEAFKTGLYSYFAHPDLFFIQYKNENGDIIWDEHCEKVTRIMLDAAVKYDIYVEINANGPNNSRRFGHDFDWLYPCENFWKIAKEYKNLKIIVGADAHNPNSLITEDTPKIFEFINRLGLNIQTRFIPKK